MESWHNDTEELIKWDSGDSIIGLYAPYMSQVVEVRSTADLLRLLIRGFGTGAMHVVCGMVVAVGLFFLWERVWLRAVGTFALLCFVITFHAIFNIFVNQSGAVFWVGSAFPLMLMLAYLLFLRRKVDLS